MDKIVWADPTIIHYHPATKKYRLPKQLMKIRSHKGEIIQRGWWRSIKFIILKISKNRHLVIPEILILSGGGLDKHDKVW